MPQIAQLATTYSSQVFWLLVFFGLVFLVVGRGFVPKVMAAVDSRDKQIAADLAAAEAARKAADAEEEAWRVQANKQRAEAHALVAAAKLDAAKATEARLAVANKTIDVRLAEAEGRIETARAGALGEIELVAAEAAGQIASRLAGLSVDDVTARAAVKEVLHG
ncbi:ATPase [Novosphingobium flavum]|uniref:ATP synthase subunit b n=1 Tax=Novosphingobium flavum TaxID=1778672 RepID=A0A7X1FSN1_9SPHN|nr:ATPase [Novosphingobium flavum]MBC2666218.1 ATPase [Novosphingobium flavum]